MSLLSIIKINFGEFYAYAVKRFEIDCSEYFLNE